MCVCVYGGGEGGQRIKTGLINSASNSGPYPVINGVPVDDSVTEPLLVCVCVMVGVLEPVLEPVLWEKKRQGVKMSLN